VVGEVESDDYAISVLVELVSQVPELLLTRCVPKFHLNVVTVDGVVNRNLVNPSCSDMGLVKLPLIKPLEN
jgi:hypothetical protein